MSRRLASCNCGQLSATVDGAPLRISICHCLSCQRRTGSVLSEQARFLKANVTTAGVSTQYQRRGDGGSLATFHFCPQCGGTVWWEAEGLEGFVTVAVGAFADPAFPAPMVSVYESRMHGWVQPPPDAEHYD